jgi:hypothetical protein
MDIYPRDLVREILHTVERQAQIGIAGMFAHDAGLVAGLKSAAVYPPGKAPSDGVVVE